jgi:hypothetical protein
MMPIEEEIARLISFLSHPAGFEVSVYALLEIRPIDEHSPPEHWEVDWTENDDGMECEYHRSFYSLAEAAQFFVEKRRYMCLGADFEKILMTPEEETEKKNE